MITDLTRGQSLGVTESSTIENPTQQREHQTRIKHRSIKGQNYRLKIFNKDFNVPFDRLWLLTVFDRFVETSSDLNIFIWFNDFSRFFSDRSISECILCVALAIFVSFLGIQVLNQQIYYDIEVLIFSCVIAASQYSLLKSCQPDVNTPVHVRFSFLESFMCLLIRDNCNF